MYLYHVPMAQVVRRRIQIKYISLVEARVASGDSRFAGTLSVLMPAVNSAWITPEIIKISTALLSLSEQFPRRGPIRRVLDPQRKSTD